MPWPMLPAPRTATVLTSSSSMQERTTGNRFKVSLTAPANSCLVYPRVHTFLTNNALMVYYGVRAHRRAETDQGGSRPLRGERDRAGGTGVRRRGEVPLGDHRQGRGRGPARCTHPLRVRWRRLREPRVRAHHRG